MNCDEAFEQLLHKFSDKGIILQVYAKSIKDGEYSIFLYCVSSHSIMKKDKLYAKQKTLIFCQND